MSDASSQTDLSPLDRAVGLLGPLEGRIMRAIWSGRVRQPFSVRDIQALMTELAYTTVMTTVNRLSEKKILQIERHQTPRPHLYRATGDPEGFLKRASREQVERFVDRFGEAAISAFTAHLDRLNPDQLERLKEEGRR